jgi:hypothetical protein
MAHKEQQVQMAHKEHRVLVELKVLMEHKAQQVLKV